MILQILIGGAAFVAIMAGIVGVAKWSARISDKHTATIVERIVAAAVAPINTKLETEFGGNSGGAREAINTLTTKVEVGFDAVNDKVGQVALSAVSLANRVEDLESRRAVREHDDPAG